MPGCRSGEFSIDYCAHRAWNTQQIGWDHFRGTAIQEGGIGCWSICRFRNRRHQPTSGKKKTERVTVILGIGSVKTTKTYADKKEDPNFLKLICVQMSIS